MIAPQGLRNVGKLIAVIRDEEDLPGLARQVLQVLATQIEQMDGTIRPGTRSNDLIVTLQCTHFEFAPSLPEALRRSRALRVTALLVTETVTRHGRGGSRLFYELSFWLVAHWYTGARCTACATRENGWSVNKPKNIKW